MSFLKSFFASCLGTIVALASLDPKPRERAAAHLADTLAAEVDALKRRAFLLETVDDAKLAEEPLHTALLTAGFIHRDDGYQRRLA